MNTENNSYKLIPISENISDQDKPLSFQIWKNSFEVILPGQEYNQYNEYLINWYKNKKANNSDLKAQIKINFLNLLKQVQVFFTEEEKENWYTTIDIDSEKEVLLAIPYFARKLKDISLYYLQLRQEIKRSKIKYNLAGSNQSVVRQIQEIILQNFSKKDNQTITLPSTLWSSTPQLSSIKNNVVIEIEELYDTASYFDRTSTLPPSSYFPIEDETEVYFQKKGFDLSSIDWVYRLGTFTLSSLYDRALQGSTSPELTGLYFTLAEKYLGSDRYSTLLIPSSARKDLYTIDINRGNNFFYYPFGPYKTNVLDLPRYTSVPLSASELQTLGTPGSSIELADTIFIKTKLGIEGAWLRKQAYDTKEINMRATLEGANSTIFRFPYPGFGVSAEDIEWTGYGTVTDPRFYYLDKSTKKLIENVYWSSSFSLSGIVPLSINSTSLVNNNAYPSSNFETADKIRVWPTPPQFISSNYSGEVEEAWLYKFLNTSISIKTNADSTILWPYTRVETDVRSSPPEVPYNVCLPEPLSAISLPLATGCIHISGADLIHKVTNYTQEPEDAIESAWLSALTFNYPDKQTFGSKQSHFSAIFRPGTYTYFVWDGPDSVVIDTVIPGTQKHLPNCKFVTTPNTTYKDYKLCTCQQILFSPFGHPGNEYIEYTGLADFIVEDVGYTPPPGGVFDISTWRDENGETFANSSAACWFKTNKNIGWGDGRWFSGDPSTDNRFYLKRGKRYVYFRANSKDTNPTTNEFPELVVRHKFNTLSDINSVWVKAVREPLTERWVSTGIPSTMVINPNDLLIYSRAESTTFNITGSYIEEVNILENRGSIWSTFDYVATNTPNITITVSYPQLLSNVQPLTTVNKNDFYKQYPATKLGDIERIVLWKITAPDGTDVLYPDLPIVTFSPSITGLYTVSVTALTAKPTFPESVNNDPCDGYYMFSNIPPITCDSGFINVPTLTSYRVPVPGFVLETKLKGWNYITNTKATYSESLTSSNIGGRPIWVKSVVDKSPGTDYKGVESWSPTLSFYDSYNPIQQPEISNIVLKGGEYIEYKRIPQNRIVWNENISIKNPSTFREWCKIEIAKTDNTTPYVPGNSLVTKQTTIPTTLKLQNVVENEPVEIYYNALSPFTWNITADLIIPETTYAIPISSTVLESEEPWAYLTNQFYPTVAFFPTLDKLFSDKELGKYFKPNNLGLLTYVNKDYSFDLTLSSIQTTDIYETPSKKIDNRGLTKQDQLSPYDITKESSVWLKEPFTAGSLAGIIKNSIFKQYQKFIPYQSTYETNRFIQQGLTTPDSLQHPWGGPLDTDWIDNTNKPISFTGQINVSKWIESQTLKNINLQLDNWSTDIYGNQYGLYKSIKNIQPGQRITIPGQLWVRKNNQRTLPGSIALLNVFDTYQTLSLYNELTGTGINRIDVYYDTLFIETSSALLFEKIQYDYNNSDIFSIADLSRGISLVTPTVNTLNREFTNTLPTTSYYAKPGDTWFFAKQKIVYITVLEYNGSILTPLIYSLDINKNILTKIFTYDLTNLSNITEFSRPIISYCSSKKVFLYTFTVKDTDKKTNIVTLHLKQTTKIELEDIKIYTPQQDEILPPVVYSNLEFDLSGGVTFSKLITADPITSTFEGINFPDWIDLTTTGVLSGVAPISQDIYTLDYIAYNSVGPTYSSLIINIT